jgi:hypothetical protein
MLTFGLKYSDQFPALSPNIDAQLGVSGVITVPSSTLSRAVRTQLRTHDDPASKTFGFGP